MGTLDPTTGAFDRQSFDGEFAASFSNARTQGVPLRLVFVDVDRFKKVNDEHGHLRGDQVLREITRRLQSCVQGKGQVYRFGGEEMVIVLPNYERDEALALAERCRIAIARDPIGGLNVTASFGVSAFPELANAPGELIETADNAMYDAKNRGRNLVRYFNEPAPESKPDIPTSNRKAPTPGALTDAQLAQMRTLYFRNRALECPNDGAYLRTEESNMIGDVKPRVFAYCPQCGLDVEF